MALGPICGLLVPFALWAIIITLALTAILCFVIGPRMYSGPEDEELWNVEDHFTMKSDDPGASDFEEDI